MITDFFPLQHLDNLLDQNCKGASSVRYIKRGNTSCKISAKWMLKVPWHGCPLFRHYPVESLTLDFEFSQGTQPTLHWGLDATHELLNFQITTPRALLPYIKCLVNQPTPIFVGLDPPQHRAELLKALTEVGNLYPSVRYAQ